MMWLSHSPVFLSSGKWKLVTCVAYQTARRCPPSCAAGIYAIVAKYCRVHEKSYSQSIYKDHVGNYVWAEALPYMLSCDWQTRGGSRISWRVVRLQSRKPHHTHIYIYTLYITSHYHAHSLDLHSLNSNTELPNLPLWREISRFLRSLGRSSRSPAFEANSPA